MENVTSVRACATVSHYFGSSEERECAMQAVGPNLLACEPVVIQWKARNFGSSNLILVIDPTLNNI